MMNERMNDMADGIVKLGCSRSLANNYLLNYIVFSPASGFVLIPLIFQNLVTNLHDLLSVLVPLVLLKPL